MIEQLQFPELVDIKDASTYLSTSIRHIRRLVQKDELPFVKIGGKLRFDKADLQRYIDEHRHPSKPKESAQLAWGDGANNLGSPRRGSNAGRSRSVA
jgi:excisionase family DNA binding protein